MVRGGHIGGGGHLGGGGGGHIGGGHSHIGGGHIGGGGGGVSSGAGSTPQLDGHVSGASKGLDRPVFGVSGRFFSGVHPTLVNWDGLDFHVFGASGRASGVHPTLLNRDGLRPSDFSFLLRFGLSSTRLPGECSGPSQYLLGLNRFL